MKKITDTKKKLEAKIETHSGEGLDLLDPNPSLIHLEDIALGLSRQSRFAGQCNVYYSVAEHSVLSLALARGYLGLEKLSKNDQRAAFMHDAHEAYIRDLPSPLKQHFPDYENISLGLDRVLEEKFTIKGLSSPLIKKIDRIALSIEAWSIMPAIEENWTSPLDKDYKDIELHPVELASGVMYYPDREYGPREAYEMFLGEAKALGLK